MASSLGILTSYALGLLSYLMALGIPSDYRQTVIETRLLAQK